MAMDAAKTPGQKGPRRGPTMGEMSRKMPSASTKGVYNESPDKFKARYLSQNSKRRSGW
jgi:hypothetical protein